MNKGGLDHIMERLRSLERENRRFKPLGTVMVVGVVAVVLMGQARSTGRVVEAEMFVLRDLTGKGPAWLGMLGKEVNLRLNGPDERGRASMTIGSDGSPSLQFYDKELKRRAAMVIGRENFSST